MSTYIQVKSISFSYKGSKEAIFSSLNITLSPGWTAIIGANGTGKTTFLKLAAGILTPDTGSICIPTHVQFCEQRTDYTQTISKRRF